MTHSDRATGKSESEILAIEIIGGLGAGAAARVMTEKERA